MYLLSTVDLYWIAVNWWISSAYLWEIVLVIRSFHRGDLLLLSLNPLVYQQFAGNLHVQLCQLVHGMVSNPHYSIWYRGLYGIWCANHRHCYHQSLGWPDFYGICKTDRRSTRKISMNSNEITKILKELNWWWGRIVPSASGRCSCWCTWSSLLIIRIWHVRIIELMINCIHIDGIVISVIVKPRNCISHR